MFEDVEQMIEVELLLLEVATIYSLATQDVFLATALWLMLMLMLMLRNLLECSFLSLHQLARPLAGLTLNHSSGQKYIYH